MLGPLLQRQASLEPQGLFVDQPPDLMRLQELEAEALSALEALVRNVAFLWLPQLLHQWQLLVVLLREPDPAQASNLMLRHFEDLAQGLVGHVGSMARLLDDLSEF